MKLAVLLTLALFTVALVGSVTAARLRVPAPATEASATSAPPVPASVAPIASVTAPPATTRTPAPGTPPPTTPTSTPTPGLTYAAVAQHASPADCWLVISNRVYDVTSYLKKHPGGAETITPWCGKESTEAFQTEDGAGSHSTRAYRDLEAYDIGGLVR